jgi:hypothetical protein
MTVAFVVISLVSPRSIGRIVGQLRLRILTVRKGSVPLNVRLLAARLPRSSSSEDSLSHHTRSLCSDVWLDRSYDPSKDRPRHIFHCFSWLASPSVLYCFHDCFHNHLLSSNLLYGSFEIRSTLAKLLGSLYCGVLLFCFGVYWVRTKGKRSPTARQITFNHICPLDDGLVFISCPCAWALMAGIRHVPIFGHMMGSVGSVFVDRSKQEGSSELLKKAIEDHMALPLAIAPEGKISNGDVVYRFRTGGFRADEEIQPLALRYYRIFPQLGCMLCWLSDSALDYFGQAFPSVGYVAEATFLEPITAEQLRGKTLGQKADMTQLAIANYLGILAIDQTTKACFQAKSKDG